MHNARRLIYQGPWLCRLSARGSLVSSPILPPPLSALVSPGCSCAPSVSVPWRHRQRISCLQQVGPTPRPGIGAGERASGIEGCCAHLMASFSARWPSTVAVCSRAAVSMSGYCTQRSTRSGVPAGVSGSESEPGCKQPRSIAERRRAQSGAHHLIERPLSHVQPRLRRRHLFKLGVGVSSAGGRTPGRAECVRVQ